MDIDRRRWALFSDEDVAELVMATCYTDESIDHDRNEALHKELIAEAEHRGFRVEGSYARMNRIIPIDHQSR